MRLYFLRHGDALETPFYKDFDRPLSDLGKRQIQNAAHFLDSARIRPRLILTSPLTRAKQTCDIIVESLGPLDVILTDTLRSGTASADTLREINAHTVDSMLLIGHEPQLSGLISLLTGGDEQFRIEMKKASLACLEVAPPAKKGHAVLAWLLDSGLLSMMR